VQKRFNQSVARSTGYASNSNFISNLKPIFSFHETIDYFVQQAISTDSDNPIELILQDLLNIFKCMVCPFCLHYSDLGTLGGVDEQLISYLPVAWCGSGTTEWIN